MTYRRIAAPLAALAVLLSTASAHAAWSVAPVDGRDVAAIGDLSLAVDGRDRPLLSWTEPLQPSRHVAVAGAAEVLRPDMALAPLAYGFGRGIAVYAHQRADGRVDVSASTGAPTAHQRTPSS